MSDLVRYDNQLDLCVCSQTCTIQISPISLNQIIHFTDCILKIYNSLKIYEIDIDLGMTEQHVTINNYKGGDMLKSDYSVMGPLTRVH